MSKRNALRPHGSIEEPTEAIEIDIAQLVRDGIKQSKNIGHVDDGNVDEISQIRIALFEKFEKEQEEAEKKLKKATVNTRVEPTIDEISNVCNTIEESIANITQMYQREVANVIQYQLLPMLKRSKNPIKYRIPVHKANKAIRDFKYKIKNFSLPRIPTNK